VKCNICGRTSDNPICWRTECQERYVAEFVPPKSERFSGPIHLGHTPPAWFKNHKPPKTKEKDHKPPKTKEVVAPRRIGRPKKYKTERQRKAARKASQAKWYAKHGKAYHSRYQAERRARKLLETQQQAAVDASTESIPR